METYSIKEIANQLNTSKQRVYRCIKMNHIKETLIDTVKGNSVLKYDKQAIEQITEILKDKITTSEEVHHDKVNDTVNDILLKQLDIKDKQIEELQKTISELQKILADKEQIHKELMSNMQKLLSQEQELNANHKLMLEQSHESLIERFKRIFKR